MCILGIETSGFTGSIALQRDDGSVFTRTLSKEGRRHAQSLLLEIEGLFQDQKISPRDCSAVAVSWGPGSFTGLRVGVVCAKTWAFATEGQVALVDTLLAIAENSPADVDEIYILADAQRGDFFVGQYKRDTASAFQRIGEIQILPADAWIADRNPQEIVSGPGAEKRRETLAKQCIVLESKYCYPQADKIVQLGFQQLTAGQFNDIWSLEPFYLRQSSAEEKWNAKHG
jgi:tRNA threonylcarbamoyladenosine biosynthesis protein TsaB